MTTQPSVIPIFIQHGEYAYRFEVSISHDCWFGCSRCKGAGCVICEDRGYFDNKKVESRVTAVWNEHDFSDLEIEGEQKCCEQCGTSYKEMVEVWLEKWREDKK